MAFDFDKSSYVTEHFMVSAVDLAINVNASPNGSYVHHVLPILLPDRVYPPYFFTLCPQRAPISSKALTILLILEACFSEQATLCRSLDTVF